MTSQEFHFAGLLCNVSWVTLLSCSDTRGSEVLTLLWKREQCQGKRVLAPPHILSSRRGTSCLLVAAMRSWRRSLGWGGKDGVIERASGIFECLIPANSHSDAQAEITKTGGQRSSGPRFVFIRAAAQGAAVMSSFGRWVSACWRARAGCLLTLQGLRYAQLERLKLLKKKWH